MKKYLLYFLTLICSLGFVYGNSSIEEKLSTTPPAPTKARISVSGHGILGNIRLKRTLSILDPIDQHAPIINRSYIEDAAWILAGELNEQGYAHPQIKVKLYKDGELILKTTWDKSFSPEIPKDLIADTVKFKIHAGDIDYYDELWVQGIPPFLSTNEIENYFYPSQYIFKSKNNKFFTKKRLKKSINNLIETLNQNGYLQAEIVDQKITQLEESHQVSVNLTFNSGPRFYVNHITVITPDDKQERSIRSPSNEIAYSNAWILEYIQQLRTPYLEQGHPDVHIETRITQTETHSNSTWVDIEFIIIPSHLIHVRNICWQDNQNNLISPCTDRCLITSGEPLSVIKTQEERDRLYKLNIYENIEIRYTPVDENTWDITYICTPLDPWSIHLLAGWGSYEMLRGGFEIEHINLFDLPHQGKLRFIQSVKSTQTDYRYNIPSFSGTDINLFSQASFLHRKERSWTNRTYGPSVGGDYLWKRLQIMTSAVYKYEILEVKKQQFTGDEGRNRSKASSLELGLSQNRLDNALYPEKGYQWFGKIESAIPQLGGNVSYERLELGGSWHKNVGSGLFFHTGLRSGALFSPADRKENIPINKRFQLGGENSIRGYTQGEASPIDKDGKVVGAELYTLINIQFQQKLFSHVSLVAFSDILGVAKDISQSPFDETLISIGGGIYIETIVGPLRFEYGYNVKKRKRDPNYAFHVSLGAPF